MNHNEVLKAMRARRVASGQCVECQEKAVVGKRKCAGCLAKGVAKTRAWQKANKPHVAGYQKVWRRKKAARLLEAVAKVEQAEQSNGGSHAQLG